MGKTYRAHLPEQKLLLPPSLQDWLPEHHLAYFVSDVVWALVCLTHNILKMHTLCYG